VIERETMDGVAVVRLAHGKVNALDLDLLNSTAETFRELDRGDDRAIVLTGAGRAFSAGVDLWQILDGGDEYVRAFLPALSTAFLEVFTVGKPVVAAVNGHAIAGGMIFAAACDHRIMADGDGRIGVTELQVGVPFPIVALEILGFALGEPAARQAVLAADTVSARDALERGYVDALVEPDALVPAAVEAARAAADRVPADTYRFTKQQLRQELMDRLARLRPALDPRTEELWLERVRDGWLRRYMERVTRR